jgi:hypothetical protein
MDKGDLMRAVYCPICKAEIDFIDGDSIFINLFNREIEARINIYIDNSCNNCISKLGDNALFLNDISIKVGNIIDEYIKEIK